VRARRKPRKGLAHALNFRAETASSIWFELEATSRGGSLAVPRLLRRSNPGNQPWLKPTQSLIRKNSASRRLGGQFCKFLREACLTGLYHKRCARGTRTGRTHPAVCRNRRAIGPGPRDRRRLRHLPAARFDGRFAPHHRSADRKRALSEGNPHTGTGGL